MEFFFWNSFIWQNLYVLRIHETSFDLWTATIIHYVSTNSGPPQAVIVFLIVVRIFANDNPRIFGFLTAIVRFFFCAQIHSFIHYDEVAGYCTVRSCQILRVVLQVLVVLGVKCLTFSLRRRSVSRELSVGLAGSFWWSIHLCNVKNACVSGFRVVGQNIYFGVLLFEHTYFVVLHAVGQ